MVKPARTQPCSRFGLTMAETLLGVNHTHTNKADSLAKWNGHIMRRAGTYAVSRTFTFATEEHATDFLYAFNSGDEAQIAKAPQWSSREWVGKLELTSTRPKLKSNLDHAIDEKFEHRSTSDDPLDVWLTTGAGVDGGTAAIIGVNLILPPKQGSDHQVLVGLRRFDSEDQSDIGMGKGSVMELEVPGTDDSTWKSWIVTHSAACEAYSILAPVQGSEAGPIVIK